MRHLLVAAALLLPPAAVQAQQPDEQQRRATHEARRDSLEAEVVQKFVRRLADDLKMTSSQRSRTERVLTESGEQRRELSRASSQLRYRIYRAARNTATTDAEFMLLLTEHERLRAQEHELWNRDQEQLARFLTPRQRAQFVLAWAHFQDDMRDILSRRMRQQSDSRDRQPEGRRDERHDVGASGAHSADTGRDLCA
ncbi:MAG: hypothetical protein KFH98_15340 [Gemmatimonadetes bacterium]|nr:hypothetical protein [Gemmatimonadota bacterium]